VIPQADECIGMPALDRLPLLRETRLRMQTTLPLIAGEAKHP
jgi:hypothetical protein